MLEKLYSVIALSIVFFAISCSESLEDTYDDFAGDGMIRYVGKCADVEVNPGWERLQVVWKHNIDAGVEKVRISWKSEKGTGEMFADPCDPSSDNLMDTVYIEKLADAMYTVRVSNVAADGSESLVEEKYGRPYSYDHEALRSFSRGLSAFSRMGDKLAVMLDQDNEDVVKMELWFTGKDGKKHSWDIKKHASDSLIMLGVMPVGMRDYFFLLPDPMQDDLAGVSIDFSEDIVVERKGKLTGCIDTIPFKEERLNLNERLWSSSFSQLMLDTYGSDWESQVDKVEILELDYDMPSLLDLIYLPNLKKVIFGKNRYIDAKYASDDAYSSSTDEYVGWLVLQFLQETRSEFTVERYNNHYLFHDYVMDEGTPMAWPLPFDEMLRYASKLGDWEIEEKGAGNLNAKPNFVPMDITDWVVTCSDTMYNGDKKNGAGMLLKAEESKETYFEPAESLGATIINVTFDMGKAQVVGGFKVKQPTRNEDGDSDYLLSNLKVEFSTDSYTWENATRTDGNISFGTSPGEEAYIRVPEEMRKPVRYIRLTMSNLPIGEIDAKTKYCLRLGKFIPCIVVE